MGKKEPKPKTFEELVKSGVLHTSLNSGFHKIPEGNIGETDFRGTKTAEREEMHGLQRNIRDGCAHYFY